MEVVNTKMLDQSDIIDRKSLHKARKGIEDMLCLLVNVFHDNALYKIYYLVDSSGACGCEKLMVYN